MRERYAIGLDLGGTDLKAGWVDERGGVERFLKRPSRAAESEWGPIEAVCAVVEALTAAGDREVAGVGVGSPGMIDPDTGTLIGRTPHLPHWCDFPVRQVLADRLGLPVVVDNDANLAAWGEHRCGAARGSRLSLTVTVGTGVGGGIVAGGEILRGARGGAGEIGHLPLGDGELSCRCGIANCVEPDMSGSGLARRAEALGLPIRDAVALFAAAQAGSDEALAMVERLGDRLGAAIAVGVDLLNPDVVVIGGGLSGAGDAVLSRVLESVERHALEAHRRRLRIVLAELGERSAVVGAGLLAWGAFGARSWRGPG